MKSAVKLVALDMDGTLLREDKTISQRTIETIQKVVDKGIKIVLCTGRNLPGIVPYYKQLGLGDHEEYVIIDNGCAIHKASDWSLVDWVQLTKQDILKMYELTKDTPIQLVLWDEDHYFVVEEEPNDIVAYDASCVFLKAEQISLDQATSGNYTMFQAMLLADQAILDDFQGRYEEVLSQDYSVVRSQTYIYEVLPKGTTKASGLERLSNHLHFSKEEVMAIGDGNNDLEMIAFAGVGVAMGNALDNVKAIANEVTDSNEADGVAKILERYFLED